MVHLTTLGTIDLRLDDGTSPGAILHQPRRFALLVYLAIESRRGFVRRDRVLGVFWPESSEADARRSLSQVLFQFRRHLGQAVLETRGQGDLRLALTEVNTDACALLDAAQGDDPEAVLRTAAGEFLPGFLAGGPQGFDEWMEDVRGELRRSVAGAGWTAAERAADRGEWAAAGAYARQAAATCPNDEEALRRLMTLQARIGDHAGALQAYAVFQKRLKSEYDAEPGPDTQELAKRIRGYRPAALQPNLTASVVPPITANRPHAPEIQPPHHTDSREQARKHSHLRRIRQLHPRALSSVPYVGILALAFSMLWAHVRNNATPAAADRPRVLVRTGEGKLDAAFATAIVGRLKDSGPIAIVFPGAQPDLAAPVPEFVLNTTILVTDTLLQASAVLFNAVGHDAIASSTLVEAAQPQPLGMERLAGRIANLARQAIGAELERRRGELLMLPPDTRRVWDQAMTMVRAADSLRVRGVRDVARIQLAAADSVLAGVQQRAPRAAFIPRKRAELAVSRMAALRLPPAPDRTAARRVLFDGLHHAERALELDPADARVVELRGVLHYWLWLTTPPDSDAAASRLLAQARHDLELATQQTPFAARAWDLLSALAYHQGRFDRAYAAAQNALAADPFMEQSRSVRVRLFWAALETGDPRGGRHWCEAIAEDDAGSWLSSYCALVLLAWGSPADAHAVALADTLRARALSDPAIAPNRFAIDAAHAVVLAKAGRNAAAMDVARALTACGDTLVEALEQAAWVYAAAGAAPEARGLLNRYLTGRPAARAGLASSQRFAGLLPQ